MCKHNNFFDYITQINCNNKNFPSTLSILAVFLLALILNNLKLEFLLKITKTRKN